MTKALTTKVAEKPRPKQRCSRLGSDGKRTRTAERSVAPRSLSDSEFGNVVSAVASQIPAVIPFLKGALTVHRLHQYTARPILPSSEFAPFAKYKRRARHQHKGHHNQPPFTHRGDNRRRSRCNCWATATIRGKGDGRPRAAVPDPRDFIRRQFAMPEACIVKYAIAEFPVKRVSTPIRKKGRVIEGADTADGSACHTVVINIDHV